MFIRTCTVNYRNAFDRLRVRMNTILFTCLVTYYDRISVCFYSGALESLGHARGWPEPIADDVRLHLSSYSVLKCSSRLPQVW